LDAELRPKAASLFETSNRRADGISCAANFVEHGAFREMEQSGDNDSEDSEADQDHIPFSSKSDPFLREGTIAMINHPGL